jgi:hypothetical protein
MTCAENKNPDSLCGQMFHGLREYFRCRVISTKQRHVQDQQQLSMGLCRIKGSEDESGIFKYVSYMMSQIWTNILKLTDYSGQGMSYEWIIIGQLRDCMTPGQKEKEKLEYLN